MGVSPDAELIRILVSMRLQGYMELIKGDYTVEERIRLAREIGIHADAGTMALIKYLNGQKEVYANNAVGFFLCKTLIFFGFVMCSHRFDLKCEEEKIMNEKANYGNWVPEKALYMLFGAAVLLGVHEHLVEHLDWNGEGRLLDIGCGAAALTVRCAKAFPKAQITAMDYWGAEWNYAKEQCERNAQIEGVADRISFQKGDAAKLDFPDETFDAAVSNFVFHEVRTAKDKRDVVREALRVVKKGGVFSFQDMFSQKALYGDMEQFVRELKAEGISEVHYIGNLEKKLDFIPGFVTTPWMISGMGIIYEKK